MKEVDDTPVPKSESEEDFEFCVRMIGEESLRLKELEERVATLERFKHNALIKLHRLKNQVANLEARKPPQDINPDPEWYS